MAASTQLITDVTTATTTPPTAATSVLAIAAAGPIQDQAGNIQVALTKLKEAKVLLTSVQAVMDAADPNKTTLANVLLSLV